MMSSQGRDSALRGADRQGAATYDGQREYAIGIIRDLAEILESLLGKPAGFWCTIAELARVLLRCEYQLLASERRDGSKRNPTIIDTNIKGEVGSGDRIKQLTGGLSLRVLFTQARKTSDGTFCLGVARENEPNFCCARREIALPAVSGQNRTLSLLLAVFERTDPPDPQFPDAKFLSYDEFFLRAILLCVASHVQDEHEKRQQAFRLIREGARNQAIAESARSLLDFESLVGLGTDPDVLKGWLNSEKVLLQKGEISTWDFEEALRRALDLLGKTKALELQKKLRQDMLEHRLRVKKNAFLEESTSAQEFREFLKSLSQEFSPDKPLQSERRLREELFESHLLLLTRAHEPPLLSQRIEEARRLSGFTAEEGGDTCQIG